MRSLLIAALLLVAQAPLGGQEEEERPALSVPEPQRLPSADTFYLVSLLYEDAIDGQDRFPLAVPQLLRFASTAARLQVQVRGEERSLRDPQIRRATLLFMSGNNGPLRLDEKERRTLGEYLRDGGLLFAEDVRPRALGRRPFADAGMSGTPFDRQFKALVKDSLVMGSAGTRWERVPHDHPLYSMYFHFAEGPPPGATHGGNITDLEMIEYRGRVAVLFSDLNITYYWNDPQAQVRERALQFGVNLLVFSVAQRKAGPALR